MLREGILLNDLIDILRQVDVFEILKRKCSVVKKGNQIEVHM